ncbi:MAG: hypothetical protein JXR51_11930 [Bacteroidales bacterium]|nr:hypothetical protein [Bacteroidales bacterium]MBN2757879.1 hypothetical protein [Bacteroidales bacterium]
MRKLAIFLFFISNICVAQNLKPTDNEAIINLTIIDTHKKALKTKVVFKSEDEEYSFQTNEKGKANFILKVDRSYRVKIPNSLTYLDFEILDFSGQILNLDMEFDVSTDLSDAATEDQALLIFSSFNLPKTKEIEIIDEKTKTLYAKICSDTAKIPLFINNKYKIKIKGYSIKNDIIIVDKKPYSLLYYVLNVSDGENAELIKANNKAFINVVYKSIYNKSIVSDEIIEIESKKGKKIYKAKTNSSGTCLFAVPKNDTYYVNISQAKNVVSVDVKSEEALYLYNCDILYPSTKEILAIKKEDSLRLAKRELEYETHYKSIDKLEKNSLKSEINKEAEIAKEMLKDDPKYFEKNKNVVCSVIFRVKKNWKDKIIVTDLTGSMYPYMKQLLIWHSLKLMTDDKNEYVFFNDGDGKRDYEKLIGNTGGIYFTDSDSSDIVIGKVLETMRNGSGGDGPENDIEALIYAQKKRNQKEEIILIADNYSPVKDISLLAKLNVPVRIILCGTDWGINPDYIEIAYKTKGSIHTIEEDIMELEKMVDGKNLKIGKYEFVFSKGKFFKNN